MSMTKQELLDRILENRSFMNSFYEEYQGRITLGAVEQIISLYDVMIHDISDGSIPVVLYPRIKKLLDDTKAKQLEDLSRLFRGKHGFEKYEEAYKSFVIGSYFVGKTYYLLKAIGFVSSNVVLIGANGCGKTTFANSIREEIENTETGIVLPAQKLLIFPTFTFLPTYKSAYEAYNQRQRDSLDDKLTFNAEKSDDFPYEIMKKYGSELGLLLSTLLGERFAKRNHYCSEVKTGDTVDTTRFRSAMDDVMDIWNNLISHRELFCDDSGNLQIRYENSQYPAFKMSDGEREILYVVGRVLLAKRSSLIIIDEPELHLHKAILNKLWDRLEQKRKDCMFIYLTHDIDFASTRSAKKCWLKSYIPGATDEWDLEPIENSIIPEPLLMKLLGSRKRILFCEGRNQSLDRQVFEELFPDYTIIPVDSCKDVIDYTRAFNKIENKYAEASGIIDSDFRTEEQLKKLVTERVFSYNVAEIENLFLVEGFLKEFADYKNEPFNFSEIKSNILARFKNDIDLQTSLFVSQRINYQFKESHVKNGRTKDEVNKSFSDFTSQIDVEKWYNERYNELMEIASKEEYEKAIRVYNNKGLHSVVEKEFGISSYNKKALAFLKNSESAKTILRSVFSSELKSF